MDQHLPQQSASTRFDPPDKVISPAFAELLNRLRIARTISLNGGAGGAGSAELMNDERVLFNYGVAQRRRVLEHTVLLIFGQYLVYRQGFLRLNPSRPMRVAYGFVCTVATSSFLRRRASQVTKDLFAHIVTQHDDSPLANEARIILAELEGPNGPYFRSVCEKHNLSSFKYDDDVVGTEGAGVGGQAGGEEDNVHPQFKLQPRLNINVDTTTNNHHPRIPRRNRIMRADRSDDTSNKDAKLSAIRMRFPTPPANDAPDVGLADLPTPSEYSSSSTSSSTSTSTGLSSSMSTSAGPGAAIDEDDAVPDTWGKPFDFSSPSLQPDPVEETSPSLDNDYSMTPAQRRAAERRRKRDAARARQRDHSNFEHGNEK